MTGPDSTFEGSNDAKMTRRGFTVAAGAAAATAVGVGASAGTVAATDGINYGSDFAHESVLESTTTVSSVELANMGTLEYTNDSGNIKDLAETHGARLQPRPETDDGEVVAHNPVTFHPSAIDAEALTRFPRETYELDADGNENKDAPVEWVNSSYWSTSTNISITEGDGNLTISASGSGTATFSHSEWLLDEDERRHVFASILDVTQLSSGATITFTMSGAGDPASFRVDDAGDPAASDVIATTTGNGYVFQESLGEVEPGVEDIDQIQIEFSNADEIVLEGLSLDHTAPWELGKYEWVKTNSDDDDEVITEQLTQHDGGRAAIKNLESIPSPFDVATFNDVKIDLQQRSRDLPHDLTASGREDSPSGYEKDDRYVTGATHKLPAAFDLDHNVTSVYLRGALPSDRYFSVGYANPSESPETVQDYQDLSITDVSNNLDPGAADPEYQMVSSIVANDGIDVVVDVLLSPDELSELLDEGGTEDGSQWAFAAGSSGGDGGSGPLSAVKAGILVIASLVGGAVAWIKGGGE